jgi:hypothetical protein
MFDKLDLNILNDPDFKEDSVREEIITPILKRLGYNASGETKILRSKNLTHPFVLIGTIKRKINIIPDYLIQVNNVTVFTLDAKAPGQEIRTGENVEQAYSYAIHPDVRTTYYGLCNGKEITIFQINKLTPILQIPINELDKRWEELYNLISPIALTKPHLIGFQPDFGLAMLRAGGTPDTSFHLAGAWISMVVRISDELYSIVSSISFNGGKFAASFDFSKSKLEDFLKCVPERIKEKTIIGISQQPFLATYDLSDSFELMVSAHFGDEVHVNENEEFFPLIVDSFEPLPDTLQLMKDIMKQPT